MSDLHHFTGGNMYDCLNDVGREIFDKAANIARKAGSPTIKPVHLLGAIADDEDTKAIAILQAAGVRPDVFRRITRVLRPQRVSQKALRAGIVPAPETEAIIDIAKAEAGYETFPCVGSDHLLRALLKHDDSTTAKMFATVGLTYDKAMEAVEKVERSLQE